MSGDVVARRPHGARRRSDDVGGQVRRIYSLDGRKLSLSAQKALRQRVIEADKKGIKRTQIAKTFGMSRQWVWKVLRAFEKHGEEAAIAGHSRGPKPETSDKMRRLSRQEEAKLMAWIIDSNPSQLKFPWAVWTRKAVRDLIRREFGKEIAIRTISAYMKRWNMTLGIATRSCRCWQMA